jgi:hypothetical protein
MIPWELVVLFSFAVLLSQGCNLDMTLDDVTLLVLGRNCSNSAQILYSSLQAFSMQVATTTPQTSSGLLTFGPDMAKVLIVAALRKANLSSV